MHRLINNHKQFFTNLKSMYIKDPNRQAVFFTSQQTKWDHNQLNIQANALSKGLKYMQFIENDTILSRLQPHQQMQMLTLKIAAANVRIKLIKSKAQNMDQFMQQLKSTKARGTIFNSYSYIDKETIIQGLYRQVPAMRYAPHGKQVISSKLRYLRSVIQTDNYPFAGTIPFKNFFRYGLSTDYQFYFQCPQQPRKQLQKKQNMDRPVLITDPLNNFVFEAAILNCVTFGRKIYIVQKQNFLDFAQKFNHQIDYVGTQQIQIKPESTAYIPIGSNLLKKHKKRFQI